MDFLTTVKGSLLENFFPKGWDLAKIDACCEKGVQRESFWNKSFQPVECENINDFDTYIRLFSNCSSCSFENLLNHFLFSNKA